MFIYGNPLLVILGLLCTAVNITAFFLIIRAIMLCRPVDWLKPFNDAGKGIIESYFEIISRLWNLFMKKHLAARGKLLIGLMALELARFLIIFTARLFN